MYAPTVPGVAARVQTILEGLRTDPIPFFDHATESYGVVDYSVVKRLLFLALYSPYSLGPTVLTALGNIEKGDPELAWQMAGRTILQSLITDGCVCPVPLAKPVGGWESTLAIACGDAEPVTDGVAELRQEFERNAGDSIFADCWTVRVSCA